MVYTDFSELQKSETAGRDYRILQKVRKSPIAIMAPHGGDIEPGTSELASAIAGLEYSFYAFEGIRHLHNRTLHITSTRFDEPGALAIAGNSDLVLTVHGHSGSGPVVYVGGLAAEVRREIADRLSSYEFVVDSDPRCRGAGKTNLCNRCRSGAGVQLEITRSLRALMFRDLSPPGRALPAPDMFCSFVDAVRQAISKYLSSPNF